MLELITYTKIIRLLLELFYEVYKHIYDSTNHKISNKILIQNLIKIMKLMLPFTPHLASECLSKLKCKELNKWPTINKKVLNKLQVNLVVQINGKTRDVISINQDLKEKDVDKIIRISPKANKHLSGKKVLKTIYIKNKIINYIIKN